jgi:hypothetical protein
MDNVSIAGLDRGLRIVFSIVKLSETSGDVLNAQELFIFSKLTPLFE